MRRVALVYNPTKVGDVADLLERVRKHGGVHGYDDPLVLETTADDPGRGMAEQAVRTGVDLVVAAGGDGTVMAVVSGLAGTGTALAVVPQGTGNLLARNLDLIADPEDLDEALGVAFGGHDRVIDVGEVGERCFAVMAGIGLDAAMMADAPERLKDSVGWPAYVVSALKNLRGERFRVELRIDGAKPLRRRVRTVLVANVGRLQAGLDLLPDAEPDDGMLDVAVVAPRGVLEWAGLLTRVLRRDTSRTSTGDRDRRLELLRGRRISVRTRTARRRQLDGDPIEDGASLEVSVRPGALRVRVPAGSPEAARVSSP